MSLRKLWCLVFIAAASATLAGCAKPAGNTGPGANQTATDGHSHDGWWCDEHGVPEEVCALCNVKLVADFKAKGDWCQDHDRPDSQCFVCHPEKKAVFAAQYEARYGKQP
jgi:hypothetical protein